VEIVDRQVQMPGEPGERLDMLGVTLDPVTGKDAFVAIELKRGMDARVQHLARQVWRYVRMLAPKGYARPEVVVSYKKVAEQMRALDLPAPGPSRFVPGMPVLALVVVAETTPSPEQSRRAQQNSAGINGKVGWTELRSGDCRLEPVEKWRWLGIADRKAR
jgi:hypothetical protein